MIIGGEFANINIFLKKPMVIFPGDKFTVRETLSLNSCTGVVNKILPNTDKKILGFNQLAQKTTRANNNSQKNNPKKAIKK